MDKPKLTLQAAPKLILTPRLRQAITLLELPLPKLKAYLSQEAANNPLFQSSKEGLKESLQRESLPEPSAIIPSSRPYEADESSLRAQTDKEPSLHDHLSRQIRLSDLNAEGLLAAEEIIACIDSNGYLRGTPEALSRRIDCPVEKIINILNAIKYLDPPGIGAKDLQECLLIQLKSKDKTGSLEFKIIERCFKELTKKKYGLIAKKLKKAESAVRSAIKEIKRLNPRPGADFSQEISIRVTPDVIIDKRKNKIEVTLNQENLPCLRVNDSYQEILQDGEASNETKQFIKKHLVNARWLIKALNQRNQNILKVTREIAKIQKRALFQDISEVRPLTLKDIAQKTNLHLSTVGRIVKHKYALTPRGTVRLKDLFSVKYPTKSGNPISGKNIAAKIKNIAAFANKPLTDQKIADILQKGGILISRRTVAKYRDRLRIPPSFFR